MKHPPAPHRPLGYEAPAVGLVVMLPTIRSISAAARTDLSIVAEAGR
jgi:hypothetical protein